ncbi:hypothetical protein [Vibrio phage vB_VhaP_VH-5]|uniref:Uncharacterized protein n=1 Tax=Vibrio phage vB_VhaP_VH-5 TaxID=2660694 RepID=A0A5Q2WA19_9CAUD|nr:hypothetical protein [Vibrio phage vB_VhaP_VH-5]
MHFSEDELHLEVQNTLQVLRGLDYQPHLIGGVLRVAALGGTTADVDIALIEDSTDQLVLDVLLKGLGYNLQHVQDSKYANETNGFLADYRKGDINIILYSSEVYNNVRELVSSFDLSINKYYLDSDGVLCNDHFDGYVVKCTESSNHTHNLERITRFKTEYPDLDWTQPQSVLDKESGFEVFS